MVEQTESKQNAKWKRMLACITDVRLRGDYKMTLRLYHADKGADEPCCTHEWKGSADHGLFRLVAILYGMIAAMLLLCGIRSLLGGK